MSVADADIKKAQDKVGEAVLDKVRSPDQASSGEEPPAGSQGRGTVDEPFDQGNQDDQDVVATSNSEPVSGKQGAGTASSPYDQGNLAAQNNNTMSIVDQLSRTKTKEEIAQKRARKDSTLTKSTLDQSAQSTPTAAPTQSSVQTPTQPPSQPQSQSQTQQPPSQPVPTPVSEAPRGRDKSDSVTTSSAPEQARLAAPKNHPQFERSVSPGQLADGSHVRCSGERGEAYSPPHGLGKLRNKLLH